MLIYLVVNEVNGKYYVGKTIKTAQYRWADHLRAAKRGRELPLAHAIRKYGSSQFSVHTLAVASTSDELNELERLFIKSFRSYDPRVGYNVMHGGDGVTPGIKLSHEHRAKLSAAHKGKPNRGHIKKGNVPWNKGGTLPDELKAKISKTVSAGLIGNKRRLGIPHTAEMRERIRGTLRRVCRDGFTAMAAKNPNWQEKAQDGQKRFWASLTPESRAEYLRKRAALIVEAKRQKAST